MAKKYFGDSDPIGKIVQIRLSWGEESNYKFTWVIPDTPENSSLQFDFLIDSSASLPTEHHWSNPSYPTYPLLNEQVSRNELSDKMSDDIGYNPVLTRS